MSAIPEQRIETLHPIVAQLEPSDEQLPAILARGRDVLVSAGAGSGKTRTLTARILSLLAEGAPLRGIVAVTFTIRAASEMRNRLRAEIQRYLARPEIVAEERTYWRRVAVEMDGARIGTIHSLCSEILRIHAAEAGLDPRFEVLDETAAALRRRSAVAHALETAYLLVSSDPGIAALTTAFDRGTLEEVLLELLNDRQRAERALDPANEVCIRTVLDEWVERAHLFVADLSVRAAIADIRAAIEETDRSEKAANDALAPYLRLVIDDWENARYAIDTENPLEALRLLSSYAKLPRTKGRRENWRTSTPKQSMQTLQAEWMRIVSLPEGADPLADLALLPMLSAIRRIFQFAHEFYRASKNATRGIDFDDLEAMASNLLLNDAAARAEWQTQIQAVLVDEFQDTNARQRDLLRAIAGNRGVLFAVGDAKQSIYRFRGADVRVFRAERETIAQGAGLSALLARSFRSHSSLLERLNFLLAGAFAMPNQGHSAYVEPFSPLVAGELKRTPRLGAPWVELHLGVGTKSAGAHRVAADALAERLLALHDAGVAWEEMALLCRRVASFEVYEDACERFGVPYVTAAGAGFYLRPEVRDLLNALRAIDDPTDNTALAGFLRSPVVGMNDYELLALHDAIASTGARDPLPPGAWWKTLQHQESPLARKAVALIRQMGALAGRVPVAEIIAVFLEQTHYQAILVAAGNQRGAHNVAKLLDDAQQTAVASVRVFLDAIADLASSGTRTGEARAESRGSVQIMTIHAAKGLEFPVVAIGDASGRPGGRTTPVLFDEKVGLLLPTAGADGGKSILYTQAAELEREMDEAEAARLLYVAATRAQELLLFSGTIRLSGSGELQPDGWLRTLAPAIDFGQVFPIGGVDQSTSVADALQERIEDGSAPVTQVLPSGILMALHFSSPERPVEDMGTDAGSVLETLLKLRPETMGERGRIGDPAMIVSPPTGLPISGPATWEESDGQDSLPVLQEPSMLAASRGRVSLGYTHAFSDMERQRLEGTLVHAALQFQRRPDDATFTAWIDVQLDRHRVLEAKERSRLTNRVRALLERYYASDLHQEVETAEIVWRELPFASLIEVGGRNSTPPQLLLFPDADASATPADATKHAQLARGSIDLLYRRPDGRWVLVDFKTDSIKGTKNTLRHLASHTGYFQQLRYYRDTVARTTGEEPLALICLLDDHGTLTVYPVP